MTTKKLTNEQFIAKCVDKYGDSFTYEKTNYVNSRTKVIVTCKTHGEITVNPQTFLQTNFGCMQCYKDSTIGIIPKDNHEKKIPLEDRIKIFIDKIRKKHGDRFDFSKMKYVNSLTKIYVFDIDNNEMLHIRPNSLLRYKGNNKSRKNITTEDFIKKAKEIHGDRYIYDKTVYKHHAEKVIVKCRTHGEFLISPNNHTHNNKGKGCPYCTGRYKTTEDFIKEATAVHGDKYDYSKVVYVNATTKVDIICKKHNFLFSQTPNNHCNNKHNPQGKGCPICSSSKGEIEISKILTENNIRHIQEHKFDDCKNINLLRFDFYLPEHNTVIEFDGIQHFQAITGFGGENSLEATQHRDSIKNEYCQTNNIPLLRIRFDENVEDKLTEFLKQQNII